LLKPCNLRRGSGLTTAMDLRKVTGEVANYAANALTVK
jgi:hypothetical protein